MKIVYKIFLKKMSNPPSPKYKIGDVIVGFNQQWLVQRAVFNGNEWIYFHNRCKISESDVNYKIINQKAQVAQERKRAEAIIDDEILNTGSVANIALKRVKLKILNQQK